MEYLEVGQFRNICDVFTLRAVIIIAKSAEVDNYHLHFDNDDFDEERRWGESWSDWLSLQLTVRSGPPVTIQATAMVLQSQ